MRLLGCCPFYFAVGDDPDYPESMRLFHYVQLSIQIVKIRGSVPDVGHIYPMRWTTFLQHA